MDHTPPQLRDLFPHLDPDWTNEEVRSSLDGWWTLTFHDGMQVKAHSLAPLQVQLGWQNTSFGFEYADLSEIASAERIDTTLTDEQRARIAARRAERQRVRH